MVRIILLICALSASDRAWIDTAIEAWQVTSVEALKLDRAPMPEMILFDETCTSTGKKHEGTITLPDGEKMPAQVTSFAGSHEGKPFLVMALPSVAPFGASPQGRLCGGRARDGSTSGSSRCMPPTGSTPSGDGCAVTNAGRFR